MTTTDRPNPRVTLRNEEILTDLLTRIRLTGTPDETQIKLMCEFAKLAHDDPDLFEHLKPAEKAAGRSLRALSRGSARTSAQPGARRRLMNQFAWR